MIYPMLAKRMKRGVHIDPENVGRRNGQPERNFIVVTAHSKKAVTGNTSLRKDLRPDSLTVTLCHHVT
jgi:hypothetical protein